MKRRKEMKQRAKKEEEAIIWMEIELIRLVDTHTSGHTFCLSPRAVALNGYHMDAANEKRGIRLALLSERPRSCKTLHGKRQMVFFILFFLQKDSAYEMMSRLVVSWVFLYPNALVPYCCMKLSCWLQRGPAVLGGPTEFSNAV